MQSAILLSFVASSFLPPCELQSTHPLMHCYISPYVVYNIYSQFHSQALREIPYLKELDSMNEAAVYGVKAALFFEFGPAKATDDGCKFAKKAIELDPNQGEWYFLHGKGLHRSRRYKKKDLLPNKEEMKHLEKSLVLSKSASKMVFLAECYVDAVEALFRENNSIPKDHTKEIFHKLGEAATELYKYVNVKFQNFSHILQSLLYRVLHERSAKQYQQIVLEKIRKNLMASWLPSFKLKGSLAPEISKFTKISKNVYANLTLLNDYGLIISIKTIKKCLRVGMLYLQNWRRYKFVNLLSHFSACTEMGK